MQIGTKLECKLCYRMYLGSSYYLYDYVVLEDTYLLLIHIGIFYGL